MSSPPFTIEHATDPSAWDAFLSRQRFRPFLQSWTMGNVYESIGQTPVRIIATKQGAIVGICQALIVPARRGKHLAVLYGPIADTLEIAASLLLQLRDEATKHGCSFLRVSPFVPHDASAAWMTSIDATHRQRISSPLHLLAEHLWYLPLQLPDPWTQADGAGGAMRHADDVLMEMRKTTRNLIRRAEKDGVTVRASTHPTKDVEEFIRLHDETRKRHKFTPYTNDFFRAQVQHFAARGECTVYLAEYQGQIIAASVHMHAFGETSYHHGASDSAHHKIPASYLLQWTAIQDALKRGDRVYNFWGIAPMTTAGQDGERTIVDKNHPFAGVTLFKTGFGGALLNLHHCQDIPLHPTYWLTHLFERWRKWKRGF